jgi:hypothetical protein
MGMIKKVMLSLGSIGLKDELKSSKTSIPLTKRWTPATKSIIIK